MQKLAYLLDSLDSIREAEGTLLDHCMILYGSGISDGDRHNHNELPILLAGLGGGRMRSGQHFKYPPNTPLCNLYLWMIGQHGIRADRFGDSTGMLEQLERS